VVQWWTGGWRRRQFHYRSGLCVCCKL